MNWREIPFVRLLIPFAGGILLGFAFVEEMAIAAGVFMLVALVFLLAIWHRSSLAFGFAPLFGCALLAGLVLLGVLVLLLRDPRQKAGYFGRNAAEVTELEGRVTEVHRAATGWRLLVEMAYCRETRWREASGRLLVYFPGEGDPRPGRRLFFSGRVRPIEAPRNPEAFDFAAYMARRGVFHCLYLKPGDYRWRAMGGGNTLAVVADRIRRKALGILRRHLPVQESFAVGAALTLGYREEMGEALRESYAHSGAIHILAVSGLHVGLLYLALKALLGCIRFNSRFWKLTKTLFSLLGIWTFVLIAGLPPSAVRAGTMFSFLIVGRTGNRQSNIYNIVAASAFFMLLMDPLLLFDVGFQLSYAAVCSIIILQPSIYRLIFIAHPVPDYLWRLISLSVAAQLGTFPLSVYYFHQFPVYFWLSGLVAVPAAGLILACGLGTLLLDPLSFAGSLLGHLLGFIIKALNLFIAWIDALPPGHLEDLWIDEPMVLLLYAWVISLALALRTGRTHRWRVVLIFLLLTLTYRAGCLWFGHLQRKIVIYHVPGHTLIDLMDGRECLTLHDGGLPAWREVRAARNYRLERRILHQRAITLADSLAEAGWHYHRGFLQFGDLRMLVWDGGAPPVDLGAARVDLLLLRGDPDPEAAGIWRDMKVGLVVADASTQAVRRNLWRRRCEEMGQAFLDVGRQGAKVFEVGRGGISSNPFPPPMD